MKEAVDLLKKRICGLQDTEVQLLAALQSGDPLPTADLPGRLNVISAFIGAAQVELDQVVIAIRPPSAEDTEK